MPKADNATTTSTPRRALLGALPAVALAALLPAICPREAVAAAGCDDAELIHVCARHIENHRAYNATAGVVEDDINPLWHAYSSTFDLIEQAEPTTLRGIVAKAFAARAEAAYPDGSGYEFEDASWAGSIALDLIRLAEEGVIARDIPARMEG